MEGGGGAVVHSEMVLSMLWFGGLVVFLCVFSKSSVLMYFDIGGPGYCMCEGRGLGVLKVVVWCGCVPERGAIRALTLWPCSFCVYWPCRV